MPELPNKGKTLWERFLERIRRLWSGNGDGAAQGFYNPLKLGIGSAVLMDFANGPEFTGYDFSVQEIREYARQIGGQQFVFTDYVLRGVNKKTFDAEDVLAARVRAMANAAGQSDALLLRLFDEFAFAEDFLGVLKDDTGIFEVTDDKTGLKETFTRMNDLRVSYKAQVTVISETTAEGKAPMGATKPVKVEYWDYWREAEVGGGKRAKEFVFVELNSETGWFQIWRGKEFFRSNSSAA